MLIRSTDDGAPALSGETGKLYDVLKWALPQLGWTLEFDDTVNSRAAFRNDPINGTGDYLRIADNPADHDGANAKTANVKSYSSMSDVDTGEDEVGADNWLICKSETDDSTVRPWAIVGDSTYFVLLINAGTAGFYQEYYFGDIASDKPGDAGAFMTQGTNTTDPEGVSVVVPHTSYGSSLGSGSFSSLRFNVTGATLNQATIYTQENRSGSAVATSASPGSSGPYPEPASGGLRVVDVVVQETGGIIRGRLKGLMRIMNNVVGEFSNFQVIENQATARGLKDCVILNRYSWPNGSGFQGVLLFDTDHGAW